MTEDTLEKLRYPIGKFTAPENISSANISQWIEEIEKLPFKCRNEFNNLTEDEIQLTYRPDGWNVRQIIHHIADSHINAYVRFKLALTEELPAIRPYDENLWAQLPDSRMAPVEMSLSLLEAVHSRWIFVIKNMKPEEFERKYYHPENKKEFSLKTALALYAWHGNHHLEHVRIAKRNSVNVNS